MNEMVERVARAIYAKRWHDSPTPWDALPDAYRNDLLEEARAAIEALSEADPTPEMLAAGEDFCVRNGMAGCWHNMLKAALDPAPARQGPPTERDSA